jgi:hypothetical protein
MEVGMRSYDVPTYAIKSSRWGLLLAPCADASLRLTHLLQAMEERMPRGQEYEAGEDGSGQERGDTHQADRTHENA